MVNIKPKRAFSWRSSPWHMGNKVKGQEGYLEGILEGVIRHCCQG